MPERVTSAELGYLLDQPPEAAIRFFERKGYAISWNWHDTLAEAHARAFTVARVTRTDLLADIHGAVAQALREGKTERWFQQTLTPVLQERQVLLGLQELRVTLAQQELKATPVLRDPLEKLDPLDPLDPLGRLEPQVVVVVAALGLLL